jgi:hypothetical protein
MRALAAVIAVLAICVGQVPAVEAEEENVHPNAPHGEDHGEDPPGGSLMHDMQTMASAYEKLKVCGWDSANAQRESPCGAVEAIETELYRVCSLGAPVGLPCPVGEFFQPATQQCSEGSALGAPCPDGQHLRFKTIEECPGSVKNTAVSCKRGRLRSVVLDGSDQTCEDAGLLPATSEAECKALAAASCSEAGCNNFQMGDSEGPLKGCTSWSNGVGELPLWQFSSTPSDPVEENAVTCSGTVDGTPGNRCLCREPDFVAKPKVLYGSEYGCRDAGMSPATSREQCEALAAANGDEYADIDRGIPLDVYGCVRQQWGAPWTFSDTYSNALFQHNPDMRPTGCASEFETQDDLYSCLCQEERVPGWTAPPIKPARVVPRCDADQSPCGDGAEEAEVMSPPQCSGGSPIGMPCPEGEAFEQGTQRCSRGSALGSPCPVGQRLQRIPEKICTTPVKQCVARPGTAADLACRVTMNSGPDGPDAFEDACKAKAGCQFVPEGHESEIVCLPAPKPVMVSGDSRSCVDAGQHYARSAGECRDLAEAYGAEYKGEAGGDMYGCTRWREYDQYGNIAPGGGWSFSNYGDGGPSTARPDWMLEDFKHGCTGSDAESGYECLCREGSYMLPENVHAFILRDSETNCVSSMQDGSCGPNAVGTGCRLTSAEECKALAEQQDQPFRDIFDGVAGPAAADLPFATMPVGCVFIPQAVAAAAADASNNVALGASLGSTWVFIPNLPVFESNLNNACGGSEKFECLCNEGPPPPPVPKTLSGTTETCSSAGQELARGPRECEALAAAVHGEYAGEVPDMDVYGCVRWNNGDGVDGDGADGDSAWVFSSGGGFMPWNTPSGCSGSDTVPGTECLCVLGPPPPGQCECKDCTPATERFCCDGSTPSESKQCEYHGPGGTAGGTDGAGGTTNGDATSTTGGNPCRVEIVDLPTDMFSETHSGPNAFEEACAANSRRIEFALDIGGHCLFIPSGSCGHKPSVTNRHDCPLTCCDDSTPSQSDACAVAPGGGGSAASCEVGSKFNSFDTSGAGTGFNMDYGNMDYGARQQCEMNGGCQFTPRGSCADGTQPVRLQNECACAELDGNDCDAPCAFLPVWMIDEGPPWKNWSPVLPSCRDGDRPCGDSTREPYQSPTVDELVCDGQHGVEYAHCKPFLRDPQCLQGAADAPTLFDAMVSVCRSARA